MPLDDIHKRYINEISDRYSLGRVLTSFICLLFIYTYCELNTFAFIEASSKISLSFLFDMKSGLLSKVSLLYLIMSFGVTLLIVKLNDFIKIRFYLFLIELEAKKNSQYEDDLNRRIKTLPNIDNEKRKTIENKMAENRRSYRRLQGSSEAVLALALGSAFGHFSLNLLDAIFCLTMTCILIYFQWESYKKYISEIFPCLVALDHGLSKEPPKLSEVIGRARHMQ